jgi:chromosome segregation ATPase
LLQGEQAKISELEGQISKFQEERGQFLSQIEILEKERQASRERIVETENLQSEISDLEQNLSELRNENSKRSKELTDLRNSLQEKLKLQLNSLQELYREIESRKE